MKVIETFLKSIMSRLSTIKGKSIKIRLCFNLTFFKSAIRIPKSAMGKSLLCLLALLFLQSFAFAQPQPGDSLLFREGEVLLSKGEVEKALWRFKSLITDYPKSPLVYEAKFRMGVCYTQLKRPKDAIRTLNELFSTFLAPARMVQVLSLLGDNYLELGDRLAAIHWFGKGLLVAGPANEELKRKVRSILDTFDSEDDLKKIESQYRGAYSGGYAKFRLALLAKRRGHDPLAKKMMMELEKEYPGEDYSFRPEDLPEPIAPPEKAQYTLGIILPLSGPHQPFGERALQAVQLAINTLGVNGEYPLISIAVRDSKGNPNEAEKEVEDLVAKEKAITIIGPLLSITVERAVKKAQQLKVPILPLSQKEFLSGKNEFVFHNLLSPSDQIQALVTFAMKTLGLQSFGTFYPNSPYGLHFRNLFMREVSRREGKFLGAISYQEEQTDFQYEIKKFFKIEAIEDDESPGKKLGDEYKQGLFVDGLFIPDTCDRVGLITSQIAYYDVMGLTFLGTNTWNGPDLIPVAGKTAEGAVFADAFFKGNPSPSSVRFVEDFYKAYQRYPETLEALCYDGVRLVAEILRNKSISSPLQLNEEMLRFQNFQGVSGLKGFEQNGKPIRTFLILKVNNRQIELVTPQ
jgi:branched-chain amino acid transport system substrate-binding protein